MSYFIHNKYDSSSVAQLAEMEAAGHTIIDYYGLLESGDETYKYVDTSGMPCVVEELLYSGVDESNLVENTMNPNEATAFDFVSSVVVKSIQHFTVTLANTKSIDVPIVAVNMSKAIILLNGASNGQVSAAGYAQVSCVLKDKETVTVSRGVSSSSASYNSTVSFAVVEFN